MPRQLRHKIATNNVEISCVYKKAERAHVLPGHKLVIDDNMTIWVPSNQDLQASFGD